MEILAVIMMIRKANAIGIHFSGHVVLSLALRRAAELKFLLQLLLCMYSTKKGGVAVHHLCCLLHLPFRTTQTRALLKSLIQEMS